MFTGPMFGRTEHILVFRTANETFNPAGSFETARDIRHCFEGGRRRQRLRFGWMKTFFESGGRRAVDAAI